MMSDKLKPCPFCGEMPDEYPVTITMVRCMTGTCAVWKKPVHREKWQQRADAREPLMNMLLGACKSYIRLYCSSDMRPEDESAELYHQIKAVIAEAEELK